ncbi:MAG: hypothetical protein WCA76_09710 [Candidatus Sulfotelmatobacter sp.]
MDGLFRPSICTHLPRLSTVAQAQMGRGNHGRRLDRASNCHDPMHNRGRAALERRVKRSVKRATTNPCGTVEERRFSAAFKRSVKRATTNPCGTVEERRFSAASSALREAGL